MYNTYIYIYIYILDLCQGPPARHAPPFVAPGRWSLHLLSIIIIIIIMIMFISIIISVIIITTLFV